MATCPNCGHVHTTSRAPKLAFTLPERADVDRLYLAGTLNKDEYFKECKRIGLIGAVIYHDVHGDVFP